MRFLDLFAGIGGFRLALERAGHECVGFCEIDKYARQTYKANFDTSKEVEWHDITTVTDADVRQLGRVDLITGGFPCQSFSVAGERRGFEDTRGTLFFEIARLAKEIQPRYLLLENVKGLLSHDKGRTFGTILHTLDELGYDCEWQLLNSKNFGVPQNRERVFIIGHSRRFPRREIFPITRTNGQTLRQIVGGSQGYRVYDPQGVSVTLASQAGGMGAKTGLYAVPVLTPDRLEKRQNGRRFKTAGEPMFTLTSQDRHGVLIKHKPEVRAVALQNANMQGRRIKEEGEPSFTISATDRHGVLVSQKTGVKETEHSCCLDASYYKGLGSNQERAGVLEGARIRRLTPLECFRLQGFPDSHHDNAKAAGVSDSQLYKQAGNAVTANVVYEIAKRLGEVIRWTTKRY